VPTAIDGFPGKLTFPQVVGVRVLTYAPLSARRAELANVEMAQSAVLYSR
jgi:hypothetical protein